MICLGTSGLPSNRRWLSRATGARRVCSSDSRPKKIGSITSWRTMRNFLRESRLPARRSGLGRARAWKISPRRSNNPAVDAAPAWSPDGRRLAFHTNRDGNVEIYIMNADGTAPVRLTSSEQAEVEPTWSPDGATLAFARFLTAQGGSPSPPHNLHPSVGRRRRWPSVLSCGRRQVAQGTSAT